jgi:hypothetical protein
MPNSILTSTLVAKEALALLAANAIMPNIVRRDMDANFTAGKGDTVNVRKRSVFKAPAFVGSTSEQNLGETAVPVKLNVIRSVDIPVTSKELTLSLEDFSKQILEPAMLAITEAVDADGLAAVVEAGIGNVQAQSQTPVITDLGKLSKILDGNKIPRNDRKLVLSVNHKYDYIASDTLIKAAYAGDNRALREADLGRLFGMDSYMDQNSVDGSAVGGTAGTATTFKVTGVAGASKVALSDVSAATGTVKKGEGFIANGILYKFTADGTAANGAVAEIAIDQPLNESLTAAAVKLVKKDYSIAFQKDCVVFATRPMELPVDGNGYVASANGFSVRVTFGYDMDKKENKFSIDVLYGWKVLEEKGVAVLG